MIQMFLNECLVKKSLLSIHSHRIQFNIKRNELLIHACKNLDKSPENYAE